MQTPIGFATLFCAAVVLGSAMFGQEADPATTPSPSTIDEASSEIERAVQSYVTAYNARDPEALTALWTTEGVYTIKTTSERFSGREAILELFKGVFGEEPSSGTIAIVIESTEFVSPNVALVRGSAVVTDANDEATESQYMAVYLKQGDAWLIDRVTEEEIEAESNHYEQLEKLDWMIGQWVDEGEGFTMEMTCDWTAKQNFISRKYSVSRDDEADSSGLQIIGWDAKEQTIRSWLFDSEGGFVSGVWTERDGQWVVQSVATLADGASGSFTSIFKPRDDGSFSWQKINQVVDGNLLPNLDEIVIQRK